jgi:flagellar hook-associated protein 2
VTTTSNTTSATGASTAATLFASLGAGSGVDINTLAKNLVDAEMQPRIDAVNAKIQHDKAQISGLSTLKYMLSQLGTSFQSLANASSFQSIKTTNSQPNAFSVTADGSAIASNLSVEVKQVAQSQQSISGLFTSDTQSLNAGQPFSVALH